MRASNVFSLRFILALAALVLVVAPAGFGCGSSGSGGNAVSTKNVGHFAPAPTAVNANRPRVAITPFRTDAAIEPSTQPSAAPEAALGDFAADEFGKMLAGSGRFTVIDREPFLSAVDRQNLSTMFKPGQFSGTARIDGVDYVLTGSISGLTISKRAQDADMLKRMQDFVRRAGGKKDVIVTATCGVAFSIIDPVTNDVVVSNASEFNRTAGAQELSIDIIEDTSSLAAGDELPVNHQDRQKIVRIALDDAIRKSLPKIDRFLQSRKAPPAVTPSRPPVAADVPATNETTPVAPRMADSPSAMPAPAAREICPVCGADNDFAARFCKKCGSKLSQQRR